MDNKIPDKFAVELVQVYKYFLTEMNTLDPLASAELLTKLWYDKRMTDERSSLVGKAFAEQLGAKSELPEFGKVISKKELK